MWYVFIGDNGDGFTDNVVYPEIFTAMNYFGWLYHTTYKSIVALDKIKNHVTIAEGGGTFPV